MVIVVEPNLHPTSGDCRGVAFKDNVDRVVTFRNANERSHRRSVRIQRSRGEAHRHRPGARGCMRAPGPEHARRRP
ncbi:hypothetical protein EVAR_25512_1 [Eumeta japonica]|uniref:Uncharacterized protein n=1 Tax=Eumeta variegata TaxID=151549 RepID=A0A4C1VKQ7_EUMVA|nr:hypothetical protein EVAR_25512_1 [Eumeta japonica]